MAEQAEIHYADATQLAELIQSGSLSVMTVVQAYLSRISDLNKKLNAIVTLNPNALEEGRKADEAVQAGKPLGPLHGVPFTVKDSIDTAGVPTQRGSPIFRDRTPTVDAVSVARMKAAGAIVLGKTNIPEFSYSTESENLLSGRTNNPWNLDRTPGGSSGGESAAIAAGLSPIGLGTDLAISVRGPASQTGIVSLKATHGRVPMTGIFPREPRRFWHVGPMARSVRDLKLAFSILAGPDGSDWLSMTSSNKRDTPDLKSLRVGWLVSPGFGPISEEVQATVEAASKALAKAGYLVENVRIPELERDPPLEIFRRLHVNEMKPIFEQITRGRADNEIGPIARTLLSTPTSTAEEFVEAEQATDRLKDGFAAYFQNYDALLCPVLPIPAHEHNFTGVELQGEKIDGFKIMAATVPFNVTGLPALSLPFGFSSDQLPINVQLVGSWFNENVILELASKLEAMSGVNGKHPDVSRWK